MSVGRVGSRAIAALLVLALTLLSPHEALAGPPPDLATHAPGRDPAAQIYVRLLAPCCWTQTLDVHESDIATLLRGEIAERLRAGESPHSIEDDLAARFGERIRAVPRDHDTPELVAAAVMSSLLVALLLLALLARSWRRRDRRWGRAEPEASRLEGDELLEYDERLSAELRDRAR